MSVVSKNIDLVRSAVQDAVVMATGVKHIRVANIHVMYSFKITKILTLCSIVPVDLTQQTHDVRMTSDRRRCDVRIGVDMTLLCRHVPAGYINVLFVFHQEIMPVQ